MATQKKSFFKIAKGVLYLLAELVWLFAISIPLAFTLLAIVEIVSLIKSIIIKCQENYNCTQEQAQQGLEMALTNEATMEQVWLAIDDACDTLEIRKNQNQ